MDFMETILIRFKISPLSLSLATVDAAGSAGPKIVLDSKQANPIQVDNNRQLQSGDD